MIILNQIEHLRSLYKELKYSEVIQFGTVTLPITLKEKRYGDALICYEYLASAYYEKGNYENFLIVMTEYEKLCLTYGKDENKMVFYYLYSLLQLIIKNYDKSIEATKKSIKYAHYLESNEFIVINHYNIAALLVHVNQLEKAKIAKSLAEFYRNKTSSADVSIVRGYVGALYYLAAITNNEEFQIVKEDFLEHIQGRQTIYNAKIYLAEAILTFNLGQKMKSVIFFELAYLLFKEQQNIMNLIALKNFIDEFNLYGSFKYTDELLQIIGDSSRVPLNSNNVKNVIADLFYDDEVSVLSMKSTNVISKEQMIQQVQQSILNDDALYCIHWCFITKEIENLFGNLFIEQLLFTLFEMISEIIVEYDGKMIVVSKNEGEAILKNISEADFFKLLMKLETKLQSTVVHSTSGVEKIPMHFGFIHSDQLQNEEVSYEQLVAFADASLYYAKSHGQLYIYS